SQIRTTPAASVKEKKVELQIRNLAEIHEIFSSKLAHCFSIHKDYENPDC
ncbi:hypothetical protein NPIL_96421, partial [Nephila pilipes]